MINNSSQSWNVGDIVKVGFLKLRVVGYQVPNTYLLLRSNARGQRLYYTFEPYYGLRRAENVNESMMRSC